MKFLKALGVLVLIVVVGLWIVVKYSAVTKVYECDGVLTRPDDTESIAKVFMKHEHYRWWVHLWSDSDGNVTTESPSELGGSAYYDDVEEFGDKMLLGEQCARKGLFSKLSMSLQLKTDVGLFTGMCKQVERSL